MELVTPEVVDVSVVGYGAATDLLVREVSPETKMFFLVELARLTLILGVSVVLIFSDTPF